MQSMSSDGAPLGGVSDGKDAVVAAVANLADQHDIRILRGGGAVFALHALISPRIADFSAFVVDPSELGRLVRMLTGTGWRVCPSSSSWGLPPAIMRLEHEAFTGRLHLYGVIPGFFADPAEVFDFMWANQTNMTVAGIRVPVLGRLCTVLLAAHDRLEGARYREDVEGEHSGYFIAQFQAALDAGERAKVLWQSSLFGGEDELRPLLEGLGLVPGVAVRPSEAYVRARLDLDVVTPADVWLIEHLERPRASRVHGANPFDQLGALVRLAGARRRVARRDGS